MAVLRTTTAMMLRHFSQPSMFFLPSSPTSLVRSTAGISIRCAASDSGAGGKKVSARLSQVNQLLQEAEERALSADNLPAPKITLDHVTVSFARSGGPGGQNVNKLNTKVDMRFNVKNAYWLSDRIKERILQMEKNRINKDGELVISSTRTRTQKGNIEDALEKLQKSKRRRSLKWLLLENRNASKARRYFQTRRHLEELVTVGTDWSMLCDPLNMGSLYIGLYGETIQVMEKQIKN